VTTMKSMFFGATNANPDMQTWDVGRVVDFTNMFAGLTLPTETYSNFLIMANATSSQSGMTLSGGSSKYDAEAAIARAALINDLGWTITDGGSE